MAEEKVYDGIDKVAILFKTLGFHLAAQLFKGISPQDLHRIKLRMEVLGEVPFKVKRSILEEFYVTFIQEKVKPAGKETRKPFEFLERLTDEQVAYLISNEPPRIMALTIAQLDVDRQSKVIQLLDPTIQPKVLTEMGNLDDIPLEGVVSIASELKEKANFLPKESEFSRGGGKSVAGILSRLRPSDEKRFLEYLEKEAPELVKEVKRYYITFEDLVKLPSGILADVLKSVEVSDIAYALKGQPDNIQEKFINVLPQRTRIILEDEMKLIEGPQPRRKVEAAQKKIVDKARELEREGRFSLQDLLEEDVIE